MISIFEIGKECEGGSPCVHPCEIKLKDGRRKCIKMDFGAINAIYLSISKIQIVDRAHRSGREPFLPSPKEILREAFNVDNEYMNGKIITVVKGGEIKRKKIIFKVTCEYIISV